MKNKGELKEPSQSSKPQPIEKFLDRVSALCETLAAEVAALKERVETLEQQVAIFSQNYTGLTSVIAAHKGAIEKLDALLGKILGGPAEAPKKALN
jgi:predicted  nucleic acid-binding Zn-ribbon protein